MKSVSIDLQIKTYDIDIAGHVNNVVYIRWLEDLRIKLFENINSINSLLESGFYLVVVSTQIKYKKQLKYSDKPTAQMHIDFIKHGILNLKFEFALNGNQIAVGEQKCVLMDLKNGTMNKQKTNRIEF